MNFTSLSPANGIVLSTWETHNKSLLNCNVVKSWEGMISFSPADAVALGTRCVCPFSGCMGWWPNTLACLLFRDRGYLKSSKRHATIFLCYYLSICNFINKISLKKKKHFFPQPYQSFSLKIRGGINRCL